MVAEEPKVAQRGKYTMAGYLKEGKIRCRFAKDTNGKYFSGDDLVRLWRAL